MSASARADSRSSSAATRARSASAARCASAACAPGGLRVIHRRSAGAGPPLSGGRGRSGEPLGPSLRLERLAERGRAPRDALRLRAEAPGGVQLLCEARNLPAPGT